MNRVAERIVTWCAVAATAMLVAPHDAPAVETEDYGITDSSSYAEVAARIDQWVMQAMNHSLEMLGIAEMEYVGKYIYTGDEHRWVFETEPEITKINTYGPPRDLLKRGDVIVAINGLLITTRDAGFRFANLTSGEAVELTIRRSRRERTLTLVPRRAPELRIPIEFTARYSDRSNDLTVTPGRVLLPGLARTIEQVRNREAKLADEMASKGILATTQYADRAPQGWMGFGLSFSGSIRKNDRGEPADWLFFELPSIKSIQPGSPADKAGLRVDDVLLKIDGLKLDSDKGGRRFSHIKPGETVEWTVKRGDETFTVETVTAERQQLDSPLEPETGSIPPDIMPPVRYTGDLGNTEVEVRSTGNVRVDEDSTTGEIVIRSGESVVRLKPKDEH